MTNAPTPGGLQANRPTHFAWAAARTAATRDVTPVTLSRDLYRQMVRSLTESHDALRWARLYGCGPTDSWAIRDRLRRTLDALTEVRS